MRAAVPLLLLTLALPAAAQAPDNSSASPGMAETRLGTVTTRATAHRRLPNTVADVSVSIEARGGSIAAVQRALGAKSQTLLGFLRGAGAERLNTEQIDVEPQVESNRPRGLPDRVVGYTGTMRASFRVVVDKLPDLIDGSLGAGATSIGETTLTPREDEIDAAKQSLATEAAALAVRQIEAVAKAAGHGIAGVRSIEVDPPPYAEYAVAEQDVAMASRAAPRVAAAPRPVAVAAGQSDISVTVAIVATLTR